MYQVVITPPDLWCSTSSPTSHNNNVTISLSCFVFFVCFFFTVIVFSLFDSDWNGSFFCSKSDKIDKKFCSQFFLSKIADGRNPLSVTFKCLEYEVQRCRFQWSHVDANVLDTMTKKIILVHVDLASERSQPQTAVGEKPAEASPAEPVTARSLVSSSEQRRNSDALKP